MTVRVRQLMWVLVLHLGAEQALPSSTIQLVLTTVCKVISIALEQMYLGARIESSAPLSRALSRQVTNRLGIELRLEAGPYQFAASQAGERWSAIAERR